jgi:hypothetical protein
MKEPSFDETNVPIARKLATGRMNAPATRDQHQSLIRLLQERKQMQPEPEAQEITGLAGIESD